jgi:endoglucanase
MVLRKLVAALCLLTLTACATMAAPPQSAGVMANEAGFRRGMNALGYERNWKDPAKARFQTRHFAEIRKGGFDFVRVVLANFPHLDSDNRIDEAWLQRLDWAVSEAKKAGLGVIIDEHDFNQCSDDPVACRPKLIAIWQQLATRYRDEPSSVAFELLNEPHGKLDAETWNQMIPELLAIVRATNPTRTVVIGPTSWNALRALPDLRLPENDRHILVTFHYYDPFRFTHQGASWTDLKTLSGVTWGSDADKAAIRADFEKVAAWARANNRPILLGEFGAYDKSGTPMELRIAYTDTVAREAERAGFAWAYWQFDNDFIAWDMASDRWVEPIRKALIPE